MEGEFVDGSGRCGGWLRRGLAEVNVLEVGLEERSEVNVSALVIIIEKVE